MSQLRRILIYKATNPIFLLKNWNCVLFVSLSRYVKHKLWERHTLKVLGTGNSDLYFVCDVRKPMRNWNYRGLHTANKLKPVTEILFLHFSKAYIKLKINKYKLILIKTLQKLPSQEVREQTETREKIRIILVNNNEGLYLKYVNLMPTKQWLTRKYFCMLSAYPHLKFHSLTKKYFTWGGRPWHFLRRKKCSWWIYWDLMNQNGFWCEAFFAVAHLE